MVTRTKPAAPQPAIKRAAPRKPGQRTFAAAKRAVPTAEPAAKVAAKPAAKPTTKPNLLRAGLKALGTVRDDVVQHQSRVFEAILGIDPKQPWPAIGRAAAGRAAQEAFGLRKFEAVFDQRVAHAMERMGMPSAQALQALIAQVAEMNETLRRLEAAQRKR
jgi:hypothetical protein